jgi:hydrogenase maturation protease
MTQVSSQERSGKSRTVQTKSAAARVLVLGWGNPSRGDDALGPELVARLEALAADRPGWRQHTFLTDFQLHPEHALDLAERDLVLFADASIEVSAPFCLSRLVPAQDRSFTTHAMSPSAVLAVYRQMFDQEPPRAYLLAIRAEAFELGEPMGTAAAQHLQAALTVVVSMLDAPQNVPTLSGS